MFIFCIKNQDGRSEAEQPESKSIPEKVEDISDTMSLLNSSGLSNSFPGVIDHSIHSLCAHDVHNFFPSSSKMLYNIPMVNPDLSSSEPILFSPPDFDRTFNRSLI